MPYELYSCPNEDCEMHGTTGCGNIGHRCWYGQEKDRELLYCKVCHKTFSAERYTVFGQTRLPKKKFCKILECLCKKMGIRGTAGTVGVSTNTVSAVINYANQHFEAVNEIMLKNLKITEIQMDEFWSYIKKKEKNATDEEKTLGLGGDRYTYVAMDAVSRLIISTATGRRIQETADNMLQSLKARILLYWGFIPFILFTSDALEQYFIGIKTIFGIRHRPRRRRPTDRMRDFRYYLPWNILYATVKKIKDGAGHVIEIIRTIVNGSSEAINRIIQQSPVSSTINTSFIERLNGSFRSFCSRLVRKTYGFSKSARNHDSHIQVIVSFYNFIRPHRSLTKQYRAKTTPAMAAGLTDHCWTFMELCSFPILGNDC